MIAPLAGGGQSVEFRFMIKASLRLALLSFASVGVMASSALAQEAPPVANPAPGQSLGQSLGQTLPKTDGEAKPQTPATAPAQTPAEAPADPSAPITVTVPPAAPSAAPAEPAIIPIPAVWAPVPISPEGRSAYGLYLAGRYLVGRSGTDAGDNAMGALFMSQVERLTPEQPSVREQAFTAALLAGDLDDAARMSPSGPEVSPVIAEAGRLVSAVQLYAHGKAREANAALKAQPILPPHALAARLVGPWIAAEARDWDTALIDRGYSANDLASQIVAFQRAQLLEIHRRYDDADALYKALSANPTGQAPFRLGYGAFLERRGRREDAIALYDAAIAAGATDAGTKAARERAASRGRAPKPTALRDGAASGLTAAATIAAGNRAPEFGAVYLRMALNVRPSDEARLMLGLLLVQAKLDAAARDALDKITPRDPEAYAAARSQIALSLGRQDRNEEALVEFQRAAQAEPTNPAIAYFLASQLIQLKRENEALAVLNGPLLATADQGPEIHFMRGAAYHELKRLPEAEAELQAALKSAPNQPTFLNYLGYLWVDGGTRVAEGAALIERAHALEPNDGNIQDSLGWAQYRQGQYEIAVTTLEEAVAKEPANAEINDHLGDAYWMVGRKREAGFQWNRVLTLDPEAERKAEVEKKLVDGLTPPTPVMSPVVAPAAVPATPAAASSKS